MSPAHRPVRKIVKTDQPAVPVGQLPYVAPPATAEPQADSAVIQQSDDTPAKVDEQPTMPESQGGESEHLARSGKAMPTPVAAGDSPDAHEDGHPAGHPEQSEPTPAHAGEVIEDADDTEIVAPHADDDLTTSPRPRPTPATSGNREIKRDVTPRRDLVTFEDEPDAKRLSNRRKRTRLNKGGMFFNERDRAIILLVAAHGWLSKEQIAALLDTSLEVRKSLRRLATHGLLDDKYIGFNNEVLYTATSFGLRKVGAEGFSGTITPRLQTIEHTDAITALHIHMRGLAAGNPDSAFITEKELQAAATSGVLTRRILTAYPWTAQYGDFTRWIPSTTTDKGKPVYKRPDGLLLLCQNGKAQPPIPVELERNLKTRPDYYQQAMLMFANAHRGGHIADQVLYFAPASTGVQADLDAALKAVYKDPSGKFRWPANLPTIRWKVRDLDAFYTPYSVTRGWIAPKPAASTD